MAQLFQALLSTTFIKGEMLSIWCTSPEAFHVDLCAASSLTAVKIKSLLQSGEKVIFWDTFYNIDCTP